MTEAIKATIVYIIDPTTNEVLMAKKTKKVGVNCWFGYGGKRNKNESSLQCTFRETLKESGNVIHLDKRELEPVALIRFYNGSSLRPVIDVPSFTVLFYRIKVSKESIGIPVTTSEMKEPTWFSLLNIPWHEMKIGDELVIPSVLIGSPVQGWVHFSDDEKTVLDAHILPCKKEDLIL